MRRWLWRVGVILYSHALLWTTIYLFWTLQLSGDHVASIGWLGQTTHLCLLVSLILAGIVGAILSRHFAVLRFLVSLMPLIGMVLTYSGTSFNLYDSKLGKEYTVFRGAVYAAKTVWSPAPDTRFDFFSVYNERPSANEHLFNLWIPISVLVIFCALPEVRGFAFAARARRRANLGLCVKCGYDLTGLTEPRCPECGSAFTLPP